MIRLAIFDMDGLMFDTERVLGETLIASAKEFGYTLTMETRYQMLGRSLKDNRALLLNVLGDDFPLDAVMARRKEIVDEEYRLHGVPIKPGLVELLQWLKAHDIKVAVCSSSNQEIVESHLLSTGVKKYVDYVIGGDKVKQSKPDPTIFLTACRYFKIDPQDAMVFEDSRNGILAASRASIRVICVPDMIDHEKDIRDLTFAYVSSLKEVIPILAAES